MFPLLIASGFAFEAKSTRAQDGLVATFLVLYTLAYSPGSGVVPFLYSSEIFPQVLRGMQALSDQKLGRLIKDLLLTIDVMSQKSGWRGPVQFAGWELGYWL